ncbi:hypothetical protein DAI22_10g062300 [Oryza sativa Japonica Group]|nr:hypothetical protein DAI22_10g062300 [Oryza sativa Japonica Group]
MIAKYWNLWFFLLLVLLLDSTLAEKYCHELVGWELLCIDRTCKFSCSVGAVLQGGKMQEYWCGGWHNCHCLYCL